MAEGEKAFRAGDFRKAHNEFQSANCIGGKDPESLLSLAHAAFARSMFSYKEAALHLRRALKYLPELPLIPLQPGTFYGEEPEGIDRYVERITRLEKHTAKSPYDADALLLLAYFRWFEQDVEAARNALATALAAASKTKDSEQLEAINIFWDGMLASGKVTGELKPAATLLSPAARRAGGASSKVEP
jgi:tetratricopeptide (TPR) repeat protein